MSTRVAEHPNEAWIAALRGGGTAESPLLLELSRYVRRVLGSTLSRRRLAEDDLAELTQEAMLHILRSFPSFRGDSAFPTWAAAVATRVAYTQLQRRDAREARHAAFRQSASDALSEDAHAGDPSEDVTRENLIEVLHATIDEVLTDRQRVATLALLRGVPTVEIAEQLESNKNAVYKLVHDARLRLREALQLRGVTAELLGEVTGQGGGR